jgi:para-nitrobenzyl esterase
MKSSEKAIERLERGGFTSKLVLGLAAICAFALGPVVTSSAKTASYPDPFAITQSGVVLGSTVDGVDEFLGIPYAQPPVGALRWLPPKAFGKFTGGPFEATAFANECPQLPGPTGSEDCLYLNVYTPTKSEPGNAVEQADDETAAARKKASSLPVMVWIHGGGLTAGAGSLYDPSPLVQQGVIVVTTNYRLGVLGFLAQSGLDAEHHERGNDGLMAQ